MMVCFQSNDGLHIACDRDAIRLSIVLNTMVEDHAMDSPEPVGTMNNPILLSNVNSKILSKVILWCEYHKNHPSAANDTNICDWDIEFLKPDQDTLAELMMAAVYLDVRGLMKVTSRTAANTIKEKTNFVMVTSREWKYTLCCSSAVLILALLSSMISNSINNKPLLTLYEIFVCIVIFFVSSFVFLLLFCSLKSLELSRS